MLGWLWTMSMLAAGPVAVIEGPHAAELRRGVAVAGAVALSTDETNAAVTLLASQGMQCTIEDISCFAKVALLAEADAVLLAHERDGALEVVAVDAVPHVGRASAASRAADDVVAAAVRALAALADPTSTSTTPVEIAAEIREHSEPSPPPAPRSPATAPATGPADAGAPVPAAATPSLWPLAGAGLAGAGAVAFAVGGLAAALAAESMGAAEQARFQDDAVRFGDEANNRLWLGGGAVAVGVVAVAAGAALLFTGGP